MIHGDIQTIPIHCYCRPLSNIHVVCLNDFVFILLISLSIAAKFSIGFTETHIVSGFNNNGLLNKS